VNDFIEIEDVEFAQKFYYIIDSNYNDDFIVDLLIKFKKLIKYIDEIIGEINCTFFDFDEDTIENKCIINYLREIKKMFNNYLYDSEIKYKKICYKLIKKLLLFIKSKIKNNKSKEYINKIIEFMKSDLH